MCLTTEQAHCVVHSYVTSHLDQNNSLLSGVPETNLLSKLQKVQSAAAKLILGGKEMGPCGTAAERSALDSFFSVPHLQNGSISVQDPKWRRSGISLRFAEAVRMWQRGNEIGRWHHTTSHTSHSLYNLWWQSFQCVWAQGLEQFITGFPTVSLCQFL